MTRENTFQEDYQQHLKHLKLKGFQPKTIDAYARGVRRMAACFNGDIYDLSEKQLTNYIANLVGAT